MELKYAAKSDESEIEEPETCRHGTPLNTGIECNSCMVCPEPKPRKPRTSRLSPELQAMAAIAAAEARYDAARTKAAQRLMSETVAILDALTPEVRAKVERMKAAMSEPAKEE